MCTAHGGGKRCSYEGCDKLANTRGLCTTHGGGKRCNHPNCTKLDKGGGRCKAHGGGKICTYEGCQKFATNGTTLCEVHADGVPVVTGTLVGLMPSVCPPVPSGPESGVVLIATGNPAP